MKNLLTAAALLVNFALWAQVAAPTPVTHGFEREFKDVPHVIWQKVHNDVWLSRFENNGEHRIAYFGNDGTMILTGKKISFATTPVRVQNRIERVLCKNASLGALSVTETYEIARGHGKEYFVNIGDGKSTAFSYLINNDGSYTLLHRKNLNNDVPFHTGNASISANRR